MCTTTPQPGWVIIAGDDRARTVLAYGDEYYFDENEVPECVQEWLLYLRGAADTQQFIFIELTLDYQYPFFPSNRGQWPRFVFNPAKAVIYTCFLTK